jgi:hypothetical protein
MLRHNNSGRYLPKTKLAEAKSNQRKLQNLGMNSKPMTTKATSKDT